MEDLNFKPLEGREWISNAVVPVSKHVQLSVSFNNSEGLFYVGSRGSYEVALQMIDPERYPGISDLVYFEENEHGNIWPECDEKRLEELVELGKTLVYAGAIEVFDRPSLSKSPIDWRIRFLCAKGFDMQKKLQCAKNIWKKDGLRFIKPCSFYKKEEKGSD